jgi:biopolymer transport protein ExbD
MILLSFPIIYAQVDDANKIEVNLEEEISTKEKTPEDKPVAKEVNLEESISMKEKEGGDEPILSPLKQMNSGVNSENVICKDGLELIIKNSNGLAACVSPSTATALIERGWAR